ncbi:retinol dehydrogenase 12-like [Lethenteron reissneri]|uniref:retinol dehydrogenase 12-like n=1 Tax=Lethenteron reissneri TaxID=7753 RepID=UPI002AB61A5D|nr:retinol dehydrogenase 12-like [Lethenteron reissneri]
MDAWTIVYATVPPILLLAFLGPRIRRYFSGGICTSKAQLNGKTVIITGANTGIGKETALDLAKRGARVILACRDVEKGNAVAVDIRVKTHNPQVLVRKLDLSSVASIREFAERINKEEEKLNILINNAGLICPFSKTAEGFEMQFGVNHLGHFLLTHLLEDLIKRSAPARIINVSSFVHAYGSIHFEDPNYERRFYNRHSAYCQSKLANVMFTREHARRLKGTGVTVNSLHPGSVMTDLQRHVGVVRAIQRILWPISKTPAQGAQTSIHCAVAEELANVTGVYFSDCAPKNVSSLASDDAAAQKLWTLSCKLLGIKWN